MAVTAEDLARKALASLGSPPEPDPDQGAKDLVARALSMAKSVPPNIAARPKSNETPQAKNAGNYASRQATLVPGDEFANTSPLTAEQRKANAEFNRKRKEQQAKPVARPAAKPAGTIRSRIGTIPLELPNNLAGQAVDLLNQAANANPLVGAPLAAITNVAGLGGRKQTAALDRKWAAEDAAQAKQAEADRKERERRTVGTIDPVTLRPVEKPKPQNVLQKAGGAVQRFINEQPVIGTIGGFGERVSDALYAAQKAGAAPASVRFSPEKSPQGQAERASVARLTPLVEAYQKKLEGEHYQRTTANLGLLAEPGMESVAGPGQERSYVAAGKAWNWQDFGAFLKARGVEKLNPWEQKLLNTAITAKRIQWAMESAKDARLGAEITALVVGEIVGQGVAPFVVRGMNLPPVRNRLARAVLPNEANVGNAIANTLQEGVTAAGEEGATPQSVLQRAQAGAVTGYGATAGIGAAGVGVKALRRLGEAGGNVRKAQAIGEVEAALEDAVPVAPGELPLKSGVVAGAPGPVAQPLDVERGPGQRRLEIPEPAQAPAKPEFKTGDVVTVLKPDGTPRNKPGTVARRNADGTYVLSGEKAAVPAERVAARPLPGSSPVPAGPLTRPKPEVPAPVVEPKAPAAVQDTGFSPEVLATARTSVERRDGHTTAVLAIRKAHPELSLMEASNAYYAAHPEGARLKAEAGEQVAKLKEEFAAKRRAEAGTPDQTPPAPVVEAKAPAAEPPAPLPGEVRVPDASAKPVAPKAVVQSDGSVVVDGYGTVKPDDARKLAEVVRLTNAGEKAQARELGATLPPELRAAGATITRAGALNDLLAAHPEAPKVPVRTAADIPLKPGEVKVTDKGKLKIAKTEGRVKIVAGVESSDLLDLHRAANSDNATEELESLRDAWGEDRYQKARLLRVELEGSGRLNAAVKDLEGYEAELSAKQLAEVDDLADAEAKKALADALGRVSTASRGVVNAGENTARRGSPAVTFRDIGGASVEDREALLAAVLEKNAKREDYRYQTKDGVLQNGANLRETIVDHGMLPSDVGMKLKQDAPAPARLDADGKKLPTKAALAQEKRRVAEAKRKAARLDLETSIKSEFDKLKEMISNGQLVQGSMGVPDPEIMAKAVKSGVKIARAAGRYGVATAEEFGLILRERVGDVSDRYVNEVWGIYRAEVAAEQAGKAAKAAPPTKPPTKATAASAPEPKTPPGQSIKNAATDAIRDIAGLPERVRPDAQKVTEWAEEAERRGLKEKAAAIAREILDGNERQFTDAESMGVAARLDELETQRKKLAPRMKGAQATLEDATDLADILDEQTLLIEATNKAGTAWGRAGVARQAYIKNDYSYTGMKARAMSKRHGVGRNLTPEEDLKLQEQADELERARATVAEEQAARANSEAALKQAEQDISDLRTQLGLQAVKLDQLSGGSTPATGGTRTRTRTAPNVDRVAVLRQTQADALARAKQKIAAASKELGGGVPRAKGPGMRSGAVINPAAVAKAAQRLAPIKDDILTYAKALVEEKAIQASELPAAVAQAFSDFGMPMSADEVRAVLAGAVKSLKPGEVEARVMSDWEKAKAEALRPFREAVTQQRAEAKLVTDAQKKAAKQERIAAEKAQRAQDAELAKEVAAAAKAWEKGEREIAAAKTRAAKRLARTRPEAQKLLDRMERIGEQRAFLQNGGKPVVGKNAKAPLSRTDPELRKLQLEVARQENELVKTRAEFKRQGEWEQLSPGQRSGAIVMDWLFGVPRTFLASGDIQGPFRQGGSALFSDPKRWAQSVVALGKGARQKGYDEIAAEVRMDPRFNDAAIAKLELPAVEGAGTPGEDYLPSRQLEKVPGLGSYIKLNQRTYDANLTVLRFGMFKDWVELAERGGKQLSAEDLRYIGNAINTLTGRGVPRAPSAPFFFALRYRLSNIDAATMGPVRRSIARSRQTGDWTATKVITQKYIQSFGLQGALLAAGAAAVANSPLKDKARVETDYRSANFGQLVMKRGNETMTIGITSPQLQMAARIARLGGTAFLGQKMKDGEGKEQKGSYAAANSLGNWVFNGATPSLSTLKTLSDAYGRPDKKAWGESYDLATDEGKWNLVWGGAPITGQSIREILQSKNFTNEEKLALFAAFFTDVNRRTQSGN